MHLIHRGQNRMQIFRADRDYLWYLHYLREAAAKRAVDIHAYAVMSTHAHIVATADRIEHISKMMQSVGLRYSRHFNEEYERIGPLWNERFRALELEDAQYALACLRYVDLNPVRAGVCADPETYQWCSYSAHAYGLWPKWLKPHPVYLSLAVTDAKRQLAYRSLCAQPLSADQTSALRGQRLYPASDAA